MKKMNLLKSLFVTVFVFAANLTVLLATQKLS